MYGDVSRSRLVKGYRGNWNTWRCARDALFTHRDPDILKCGLWGRGGRQDWKRGTLHTAGRRSNVQLYDKRTTTTTMDRKIVLYHQPPDLTFLPRIRVYNSNNIITQNYALYTAPTFPNLHLTHLDRRHPSIGAGRDRIGIRYTEISLLQTGLQE